MQITKILLLSIIITPIIGSFLICCINKTKEQQIKIIGFSTAIINFILSLFLWILFDEAITNFQYLVTTFNWNIYNNINLTIGVDGISIFLILLTTFLIPICLLTSWNSIKKYTKEFIVCFLLLDTILCVTFSVLDIIIFYIFFETVLIPMFLIIGIWGNRTRKIRASYLFFLYTLVGSLLMLLALLLLSFQTGTTDLITLYNIISEKTTLTNTTIFQENIWSFEREKILWFCFFISFAVKIPMVPFHIWLPEAHVEAPTAGSMLLAGILLKLGTYGFIRFLIPLFPEGSLYFTPLIYTLSIIAVVYTSLTALRQIDLKKIIAYSSVAHMGFVTIGLFTNTVMGIEGAMIIMISHGFISTALFFCVGVLYDRFHTRVIKYYRGIAQSMPLFSLMFIFFSLANLGFPGTSSFVGEFLTLLGVVQTSFFIALIAGTGMIISAAYSLWLCNRILFGETNKIKWQTLFIKKDVTKRELAIFIPLVLITLWMGVYPASFLNVIHPSIINSIYSLLF